MHVKKLVYLAGSAALFCLSCAPVTEPSLDRPTSSTNSVTDPLGKGGSRTRATGGLSERIEAAVLQIKQRDLLTTNSFWTVFHGILGMGLDSVLLDPQTNRRSNAVEYIRRGGEIRGMQFFETKDGLDVRTGPPFVGQGHQDQFIAEMVQWGLPADTKFTINGKDYLFSDFFRHTKARASVTKGQELSWAIIVIGQHFGLNITWTNNAGEKLQYEDLIRYELNEPIESAACGGTHRLFGLTWCYYLHLKRGGKTEGVWKDVANKIELYKKNAKKFRNPDGSFSSNYVSGPGASKDVQVRISTSGHVFEWLSLALADDELKDPWVQEAASALSAMILDNQGSSIESGALYHACHGLQIYHKRVYGDLRLSLNNPIPLPPQREEMLSKPR